MIETIKECLVTALAAMGIAVVLITVLVAVAVWQIERHVLRRMKEELVEHAAEIATLEQKMKLVCVEATGGIGEIYSREESRLVRELEKIRRRDSRHVDTINWKILGKKFPLCVECLTMANNNINKAKELIDILEDRRGF